MWCGTGKTRVFTYSILEDDQKINVIVYPSLGLIKQFNLDYIINPEFIRNWTEYDILSFCSADEKKLENKNIKDITYTTSTKKLLKHLKKDMKLVLI